MNSIADFGMRNAGSLTHEENRRLLQGICPDCGSTKIIHGPCGGFSQNVLCEGCRIEFNMGFISERLASPCETTRQKEVYGL